MYQLQNESAADGVTMSCQCYRNESFGETYKTSKFGFIYPIIGWMCFAVSLLFLPILFGGAALFMGIMTFFDRSPVHGVILMFFSASGLVLGTLFNVFVTGTMFI